MDDAQKAAEAAQAAEAAKNGTGGQPPATDPQGKKAEEPNPSKAEEGLRKTIEELRLERAKDQEMIAAQNAAIADLKALTAPLEAMRKANEAPPEPQLDTTEGWMKVIESKTTDALKPVQGDLEQFKIAQKNKAMKIFVQSHPEYDPTTENGKARITSLLKTYGRVKTRGEMDSEELLEDLQDAWAVENRATIQQKEQEIRSNAMYQDATMADFAATGAGGSTKTSDAAPVATPEDVRIAKSIGMDLKRYLELKPQAAAMEFNG